MQRLNYNAIMMTADGAFQSKVSAVHKGYYKDPFTYTAWDFLPHVALLIM